MLSGLPQGPGEHPQSWLLPTQCPGFSLPSLGGDLCWEGCLPHSHLILGFL